MPYFLAGWPNSVYDDGVWRSGKMQLYADDVKEILKSIIWRSFNMQLHADDLKKIVKSSWQLAAILHNLLIETPFEEEWIDEVFLERSDDDELNTQVPMDDRNPNLACRQQLLGNFIAHLNW
jgi:hypothetical protein